MKADIDAIVEEIWAKYDVDKSNELDKQEARVFLKEFFGQIGGNFSEAEFTKLFDEVDVNGNGRIDKNEMR